MDKQKNNCIFCDIANKEMAGVIIYEDDDFISTMDINPVNFGHTLVMPKKHYENIYDTPEKVLEKILPLIKKIAVAVKKAVKAEGINIINNNETAAGQAINHIHFHIIPRYKNDGFVHWKGEKQYWGAEINEIAEKIKENI